MDVVVDLPLARILALVHSYLGMASFFVLLPLVLMTKKGSRMHRKLGMAAVVLSGLFYLSGEAIPLNKILSVPNYPPTLFALVSCVNLLGLLLVALGFSAVRRAPHYHAPLVWAVFAVSLLLMAFTFVIPYKSHYIVLGIFGVVLVLRDVVARATQKPLPMLALSQHAYYMLGAYLYAALFLTITMPIAPEIKIGVAITSMAALVYVLLPARMAHMGQTRRIPPMLSALLAITYGGTLIAIYANLTTLWCPLRELPHSPACQLFYRLF